MGCVATDSLTVSHILPGNLLKRKWGELVTVWFAMHELTICLQECSFARGKTATDVIASQRIA